MLSCWQLYSKLSSLSPIVPICQVSVHKTGNFVVALANSKYSHDLAQISGLYSMRHYFGFIIFALTIYKSSSRVVKWVSIALLLARHIENHESTWTVFCIIKLSYFNYYCYYLGGLSWLPMVNRIVMMKWIQQACHNKFIFHLDVSWWLSSFVNLSWQFLFWS